MHSSRGLCSLIAERCVMALLLLLPTAIKLLLLLHLLQDLPAPNGWLRVPRPRGSFPFLLHTRA